MKVLVAGANGYIGSRFIPVLLEKGHEVVCLVRDKNHFYKHHEYAHQVTVKTGDLLRGQSMEPLPDDIIAAYYLANSMTQTSGFAGLEALSAHNFIKAINNINCKQIITLSEINNTESEIWVSRRNVEEILATGKAALTILNTPMIIGEGSIALEMFKALTEKTPILIAQSWTKIRAQPIALTDVLAYLEGSLLNENTFNRRFDIGGPEVLLFKQMLLTYIAICKELKPSIVAVPYISSKLSSYLLNLLNPISYSMAQNLVESLKTDTVCREDAIKGFIPRKNISFKQTLLQTANIYN